MIGQNGNKMISNTGKLRGVLCSVVPVSLIIQLTTQQEVYLLICLSSSVLAFQRFILVAVRFFSAVMTCDIVILCAFTSYIYGNCFGPSELNPLSLGYLIDEVLK